MVVHDLRLVLVSTIIIIYVIVDIAAIIDLWQIILLFFETPFLLAFLA